jgi:hypothetical protein
LQQKQIFFGLRILGTTNEYCITINSRTSLKEA